MDLFNFSTSFDNLALSSIAFSNFVAKSNICSLKKINFSIFINLKSRYSHYTLDSIDYLLYIHSQFLLISVEKYY
jgi:hypothetical protein